MVSIGKLVKQGFMRVRDYFYYIPDVKEYATNPANTGCESSRLTTDLNTLWIIYNIYPNFSIDITTVGVVNVEEFRLYGIAGYIKGIEELNRACRQMYGMEAVGASARSFCLNDLPLSGNNFTKRCAYYPFDAEVKQDLVDISGKKYEIQRCLEGVEKPLFYAWDSGGEEVKDRYGTVCRTPAKDNPVLVTATSEIVDKDFNSSSDYYWLATQSTKVHHNNAGYCMYCMTPNGTLPYALVNSNNNCFSEKFGLKPIVHLSSILEIDEKFGNGSIPRKAWRLVS